MRRSVGVKYCGGCNPRIDRKALAARIEQLLPPGCRLETLSSPGPGEVAVLICGCPVACVDRPEVRRLARHWVRVGGATVDSEPVPPGELAVRVVERILAAGTEEEPS
jgi:hypothetical protein